MRLFRLGDFQLASGERSRFKIECDALSAGDWRALAALIAERAGPFSHAVGVPTGGYELAACLNETTHDHRGPRLVVDDVLTTGGSIAKVMKPGDFGFVVFARGPLPENVRALFRMEPA